MCMAVRSLVMLNKTKLGTVVAMEFEMIYLLRALCCRKDRLQPSKGH